MADATYNTLIQLARGGGSLRVATGGDLIVECIPQCVKFSPAAAGSNVCEVTITVYDIEGSTSGRGVTGPVPLLIHLSDSATGEALTATTASGAVAAKSGDTYFDLSALVAKKALLVQTNSSGVYVLSITDTAKTGFYIYAVPLFGVSPAPCVSDQLVTANYG